MPESTLTLCQSRLYPPVRDLGFGLWPADPAQWYCKSPSAGQALWDPAFTTVQWIMNMFVSGEWWQSSTSNVTLKNYITCTTLQHLKQSETCARNYRTCFRENQPKTRFLLSEYERFGLVFTKTRVYKFGHCARIYKGIVFSLKTSWKCSFLKTNVFAKR
jgi:hypothetical protein